jgi:hypothetical protein
MATWHQQQARNRAFRAGEPICFQHETRWTVLTDPPGGFTSMMLFGTAEEAKTYVANLKKHGNDRGEIILPPKSVAVS